MGLHSQKEQILEVADRVFKLPDLKKILEKFNRKPLRIGFEKIKGKKDKGSLKVALLLLKGYHDDEKRRLFGLWKLFTQKGKNDEQIVAISKRPHFVDGVSRLAEVLSRGPRNALRILGNNSIHKNRQKDAVKRFRLAFSRGVLTAFLLWAKKAGISSETEDLAKFNKKLDSFHPLHLLFKLKPLRLAFSHLK